MRRVHVPGDVFDTSAPFCICASLLEMIMSEFASLIHEQAMVVRQARQAGVPLQGVQAEFEAEIVDLRQGALAEGFRAAGGRQRPGFRYQGLGFGRRQLGVGVCGFGRNIVGSRQFLGQGARRGQEQDRNDREAVKSFLEAHGASFRAEIVFPEKYYVRRRGATIIVRAATVPDPGCGNAVRG